jgi:hypothetical protein
MISPVGMHLGFIAARCPWPDLRSALEDQCGPLAEDGPVPGGRWQTGPRGQGILRVASGKDCSYVLDELMALSSNCDLIVTLSRQLSCRIIGAGAETVSGTYWFTAASGGSLARLHYDQKASLTGPFDLGSRLPSETTSPFDHPGGMGILAGIHIGGFDVDMLLRGEPGGMQYTMTTARLPPPGDLARQRDEHARTHRLPDAHDWTNRIAIVPDNNADYGFELRVARQPDRGGELSTRPPPG